MANTRGNAALRIVIVVLLLAIVALLAFPYLRPTPTVKFETEYQAVLLTGGQVYFGKLEGFGTSFPVLRDVYYVQSKMNPETKEVTNILIRRGKEWHAPDRMYVNPGHIVLVEPVSPTSQVAQLIAESRAKP